VIESSAQLNQPFFIMLSYDAVHGPLRAPDELVAKYRGRGIEDSRRATMLAMIEAMDVATGRVLDAIDRTDRRDETIVVFVSDNGGQEPYGINTPWRGWKGELYEGGVHGIGVVRAPGLIKPGTTNAQPIAMYDLFPTLAGLAGVPTGVESLDGVDLSTALTSGRLTTRPPIAVGGGDVAIIDGDWKLLRPRRGAEELYNLASDPAEATNRLADEPEIAARLRAVADALPKNQAFQKSGGGRGGRGGADGETAGGGGRGGGGGGGGGQRDPDRRRPRRNDTN
jgi:arylsulfatase A-like enzyme